MKREEPKDKKPHFPHTDIILDLTRCLVTTSQPPDQHHISNVAKSSLRGEEVINDACV